MVVVPLRLPVGECFVPRFGEGQDILRRAPIARQGLLGHESLLTNPRDKGVNGPVAGLGEARRLELLDYAVGMVRSTQECQDAHVERAPKKQALPAMPRRVFCHVTHSSRRSQIPPWRTCQPCCSSRDATQAAQPGQGGQTSSAHAAVSARLGLLTAVAAQVTRARPSIGAGTRERPTVGPRGPTAPSSRARSAPPCRTCSVPCLSGFSRAGCSVGTTAGGSRPIRHEVRST